LADEKYKPVNFKEKFKLFHEHWTPKVIAELNDYQFKLARLKGEFVWHKHDDSDEAFIVIEGDMTIFFRDGQVNLAHGEMFVVPKGVEHKPQASDDCMVLLLEPVGIKNTGDVENELTAKNDVWI
jgi:mannose-6-phosphate isomerase-like protein (cupin superfamily)